MQQQAATEGRRPPRSGDQGLTWEFWLANLANLLVLAGSVMFVLLPAYEKNGGMANWAIGFADGAFWLVSVFLQPWLGPCLDRYGRKPFLIGGALLMGTAAAAYAFVPVELVPMLCLRTIHGLGFSMYLTSSWTWVADYAPPGRIGEVFGIFGISGLVAGAAGPGLAEFMRDTFGFKDLFWAGTGLILMGLTFCLWLTDRHARCSDEAARIPHFFRLISTRSMRGTALGALGFGVAVGSIFAFVAPYLDSLNITGIGGLFACTTLASGASRVYAGRQTDRLGASRLIVPALMLLAAGCITISQIAYAGSLVLPVLIGSGLAAGIGYGVVYPALNALALERLSPEARGRGLSVVTAAIDLGSTAGAAVAGVVASQSGYPACFIATGAVVAVVAILFALLERSSRPAPA